VEVAGEGVTGTQPMCAVHLEAPSVVTCHRCGRFCCVRCMSPGSPCNECVARLAGELPALEPRAKFARYALYAMAVSHGVQAALETVQLLVSESVAEIVELMNGLALLAYIPLYITTVVLICRWFHLATRHALARGASVDASPAGAVWSWFIPFVNLARPFSLTRNMLISTGADPGIVAPWQTAWLVGNVISNYSARAQSDAALISGALGDVLLIIAAIFGAKVIASLKFD